MDAIVIGRATVDLYANEVGVTLKDVRTFTKFLGGSSANTAVGLARLGASVAFVGRVGRDPFGAFVREFMRAEGIDVSAVRVDPSYPTALAFAEMHPPDHFPLLMYRRPSADTQIAMDDIDAEAIASGELLIASGTNLAESPSREATLHALALRAAQGRRNVFDVDFRPAAWTDPRWATIYARAAAACSDVVLANEQEMEVLTGEQDTDRAATRVLEWGPDIVVAKQGARGVLVHSREAGRFQIAAIPVQVVNTLGAGDGFAAGFCYGLLRAWPLPEAAWLGVAVGAIVASRHSCSEAMPTLEEAQRLLRTIRGPGVG
jgi:5-dehydro-2-deoxygluconokinase